MTDPLVVASVTVGALVFMIALGAPITLSAASAGLLGYYLFQGGVEGLQMGSQTPFTHGFSYNLLALPIFVFMGSILDKSGVVDALFKTFANCLGRVPGSLGVATMITSGGLGAASGSGAAAQATMTQIAWPHLKKYGYSHRFALGLINGGGSLEPLIPPSAILIIYGTIASLPIGELYAASMIPGIVMMLVMIAYVIVVATIKPHLAPPPPPVSTREKIMSLVHIFPFSMLIFAVLGSIYFGWATATEAASIGVAGSLVLLVLYRQFSVSAIVDAVRQAVVTGSFILMIVVFINTMATVLNFFGFADWLAKTVTALNVPVPLLFAAIVLMYLILGCFIDGVSQMVLTVPFLIPLLEAVGIDLIWFGIVLVILIEVGTITPPFGLHLFIIGGITGKPVQEIFAGAIPFVLLWMGVLVLLWFWPEMALWLPSTMK